MASRKEMIWQNDFSMGAVRPEAEERDDTDLVEASLYEAENTISLTTGQVQRRPGTIYLDEQHSRYVFPVSLGGGRIFQVHIVIDGYRIYNDGEVLVASGAVDWVGISTFGGVQVWTQIEFWAVPAPDFSSVIIGSKFMPLYALRLEPNGTWTFGLLKYAKDASGAPLIPFYRQPYFENLRAVPGAGSSVSLTTDFDFFVAGHVGTHIRHNGTPIVITAVSGPRNATGNAFGTISRTLLITVTAGADFSVGDAVEHSVAGGTGIVTGVSGNVVTILSLGSYKNFPASGNLIGPNAKEAISAVDLSTFGALVPLWDAQMFSKVAGYANWGALHKGRFYLCDYPAAPRAFAVSQAGDILNFQDGANDADGFVETISSDRGGDLKYIVSAEDLLFLTTRGLYYQQTRDGTAVTPRSIAPIPFSQMGVSAIAPQAIEDGAIFVDAVGNQVVAAVLSGDAYRSWRTVQIAQYHSHLISRPRSIGATAFGSETPEQFVYVVNFDGSAAVCQWDKDQNRISWRPWTTDGDFHLIYQAGSHVYALVDRNLAGTVIRSRERFVETIYTDCTALWIVQPGDPTGKPTAFTYPAAATPGLHLEGETVQVYLEGWDYGDLVVNADGRATIDGEPVSYPTTGVRLLQLGLGFTVRCTPWSRRSIRTSHATRNVKRLIDLHFTVQATGSFTVNGVQYGGYDGLEASTVPPDLMTREVRIALPGGAFFERVPLVMDRPGPFRLLKIGYRVSV